jgi:hypothetical protein
LQNKVKPLTDEPFREVSDWVVARTYDATAEKFVHDYSVHLKKLCFCK